MFDNNYKNAMDSITVDGNTRDKILDKIILKEELKSHKNPAIPWRIAFACVACVAIVLGVIFVPRDNLKMDIDTNKNAPTMLKVSKSYDEIYKLLKPRKDSYILYGLGIDDAEVEYIEDQEYIASEGETFTDGNTNGTATNDTAMPGSTENTATKDDGVKNEAEDDFSTTTEQVEGVSEADIVKTDGKYIYYIKGTTFSIFKADGENSALVSQTELSREYTTDYGDMFLKDDRVIILQPDQVGKSVVSLLIYDVSDPINPKKVNEVCQDGWYNTSRMVGDYIYIVSNCHINLENIDKDDPTTFVPTTEANGVCEPVPADSIYRYEEDEYTNQYTVIGAFNYKDGVLNDTASLLGGTDNVYCSQGNIILANRRYKNDSDIEGSYSVNYNVVSRLEISKGKIEYKVSGEVDGEIENQFFIDEHNGYFRFVTTATIATQTKQRFDNTNSEIVSYSSETSARLTVLDSTLKKVGEINDLAKGERVYSVRFMGDIAYFVTFRQTDPLFSADLSDPASPKILGELKIPGFSEYMYPYGDDLLLGFGMDADKVTGRTTCLKLSMFDITDPTNVTEQNKTLLDKYSYSPALYNHKAMLVQPEKNLIGFAATDDFNNSKYMIYKYTGSSFERTAVLTVETDYKYAMDDVRGLFVGNAFYVISKDVLQIFDMNTFLQIGIVEF